MRKLLVLAAVLATLCFVAQGQTARFPARLSSMSYTSGITGSGTNMFNLAFEPESQFYQTNSLWWADSGAGMTKTITYFANQPFEVTSIDIQADCGETMNVYYREPHTNSWKVYGSLGPRTCPGLRRGTISVVVPLANAFYIGCQGSDLLCSVSRFIPYGFDGEFRYTDTFTSLSTVTQVRYAGSPMGVTLSSFYSPTFLPETSNQWVSSIYWARATSDVRVFFQFTQSCTIRTLHIDADCDDTYVVEGLNYNTGVYDVLASFGSRTCPGYAVRELRNTNGQYYVGVRIYCTGGDGNCALGRTVLRGSCTGTTWITPLLTNTAQVTGSVSNAAALNNLYSINTQAEFTVWTEGTYWNVNSNPVTITAPFVHGCNVERVMLLADCNDQYPMEYWTGSTWQNFYTAPLALGGGCGLRMRVYSLPSPIYTSQVRVNGCTNDPNCAVSSLLLFGSCPITPVPITIEPTTNAPTTSPPLTTAPLTAPPLTQPPKTTAPTTLAPRTLPENACCQENIDTCYALLDQCDAINCGTAPTVGQCTVAPVLCTVYNACVAMLDECVDSTTDCVALLNECE